MKRIYKSQILFNETDHRMMNEIREMARVNNAGSRRIVTEKEFKNMLRLGLPTEYVVTLQDFLLSARIHEQHQADRRSLERQAENQARHSGELSAKQNSEHQPEVHPGEGATVVEAIEDAWEPGRE